MRPSWLRTEHVAKWLKNNGFHVADYGALDAALHRPFSSVYGHELYPDVWLKTAALLHSIESTHPMMDGNKRTGVILCHALLCDAELVEDVVPEDGWFELVLSVASGNMDIPRIVSELKRIYDKN